MSRVEGQLLTCDRCGEQIFLKLFKTESLSGGFERSNVYSPPTGSWTTGRMGCRDLCPACSETADFIAGHFKKFCGNCAVKEGSKECSGCEYPEFSGWQQGFDTDKIRPPTTERGD